MRNSFAPAERAGPSATIGVIFGEHGVQLEIAAKADLAGLAISPGVAKEKDNQLFSPPVCVYTRQSERRLVIAPALM